MAPPGLREISDGAFCNCKNLKRVVLNKGLQTLWSENGEGAFEGSGLGEITLPSSIKQIGNRTLSRCRSLRVVYVEDGWNLDFSQIGLSGTVQVGPPPDTMFGAARVWDLRELREVTIPNGIERIGRYWFWDSKIEIVTIPVSVVEIGSYAFGSCCNLR